MIENIDQIPDFNSYIPVELEHESVLKSRAVDLTMERPRLKKDIVEEYKDPDVNSVGSEAIMIKRYDEESDNEVVLKPSKPKNPPEPKKQKDPKRSAKKKAVKPAVKKRFANENLITTNEKKKLPLIGMPEKDSDSESSKSVNMEPLKKIDRRRIAENKPPLIGMPEKDSDSEDNKSEFILPLIQEKKDKKGVMEKNDSKASGPGSISSIIAGTGERDHGDVQAEEKEAGYEGMSENIPYEYWNTGGGKNDEDIIVPAEPKQKGGQKNQEKEAGEDLIEGFSEIAAEEVEKGPTYDDSLEPDMAANEAQIIR